MAAKIKTLKWDASNAEDTTGYNVYISQYPNPVTNTSQKFDVGNVTSVILNDLIPEADGEYNIGVSTYDDSDNEGPMEILSMVPLDFVAPSAPTNLRVE